MRAGVRLAGLGIGLILVIAATARMLTGTPAYAAISVPATAQSGVNTGVFVLFGDSVSFTGSGSGGYGFEGNPNCHGFPTTHPDGSRFLGDKNCGPKDDPNAQLAGGAIGLMIARVGSGPWFGVGSSDTRQIFATGELFLAYNDVAGEYGDNTGSYTATVVNHGGGHPTPTPTCKPIICQ